MELGRQGVDISNGILMRGIVLPNREARFTDPDTTNGGKSYPTQGDFLMENPFKKKKLKKKKKNNADSPLRRRGKKSKSPTKKS